MNPVEQLTRLPSAAIEFANIVLTQNDAPVGRTPDADVGLEQYVCDELHWGIREVLRHSGHEELTLLGWCIGGTLCLMYAGLHHSSPVRNMALLTTPVDTRGSLYETWVGRDSFDVD